MKYIRTEDGVYDTSKGIYTPSINMWAIGTVTIYDEQILKQADTIEELLDVIAYVWKNGDFIITHPEERKEKNYYEYESCYGVIITSLGLFQVAKLNKEGVWELI